MSVPPDVLPSPGPGAGEPDAPRGLHLVRAVDTVVAVADPGTTNISSSLLFYSRQIFQFYIECKLKQVHYPKSYVNF